MSQKKSCRIKKIANIKIRFQQDKKCDAAEVSDTTMFGRIDEVGNKKN
jgi:hypothetical protein